MNPKEISLPKIRVAPSEPLESQSALLVNAAPDGWQFLRVLRAAKQERASLAMGSPLFARLNETVKNWKKTPDGENELAFVLIAAIEDPEDTGNVIPWLLDAGLSPNAPHELDGEEDGKLAYPLATAVEWSMDEAAEALMGHGAVIGDQTIKAAVFQCHCRERAAMGKKTADEQRIAAVFRAEKIALALLERHPGVDVWAQDDAIGPSIMHWACCLPHDRMLRALCSLPQGDLRGANAQPFLAGLLSMAVTEASGTKTLETLMELASLRQEDLDQAVVLAVANNKTAWLYRLLEKGATSHLAKKWAKGESNDDRLAGMVPYAWTHDKDTVSRGFESLAAWEESHSLARDVKAVEQATQPEKASAADCEKSALTKRRRI